MDAQDVPRHGMKLVLTDEQQVYDILHEITSTDVLGAWQDTDDPAGLMTAMVDNAVEHVQFERMAVPTERWDNVWTGWRTWYARMGRVAIALLGDSFHADELANMLVEKHRKYGPRPLRRWGDVGLAIRLDSKVSRYRTMTEQGIADDIETSGDTLTDIVGYAVLGIAMNKENTGTGGIE